MPLTIDAVRWDGCYDAGWRDLIVPSAFAHPAKMARGLVARIFDELFEMGALERGSVVVDPFGGIGTTAIEGASRGVQVVCCELEPKFVDLARQNFALHRRDWKTMGRPMPMMVQGDSRKLRAVLRPPLAACVVSSPPYAESVNAQNHGIDWTKCDPASTGNRRRGDDCQHGQTLRDQLSYGDTPGQLGALPAGAVDAVISSPPYAKADGHPALGDFEHADGGDILGHVTNAGRGDDKYGCTAGQIATLPVGDIDAIVCSPPYSTGDSASAQSITTRTDKSAAWVKANCGSAATEGYGLTPGQLGVMPAGPVADALVSSPPYEGSLHASTDGIDWDAARRNDGAGGEHQAPGASVVAAYPSSPENIGNVNGETFWSAALDIVRESYAILKPGGVAVWVVKHFVRNKQIVDFPGDWRKLCEHVGFETFMEVHASLVTEETRSHLFDGERTTRRERKSFFRRLAEKKGSPRIDFETVYFMRKPAWRLPVVCRTQHEGVNA